MTVSRRGIVLAGGTGSRLFPITKVVSKQLVPVYDKPMVYYPLSVLMLAGIREVLVITNPQDQAAFRNLLGDGSQWGMCIEFAEQARPEGIAQALIIAETFLAGQATALVLGDNIFFGHGFSESVRRAAVAEHATIFGYRTHNPTAYGVASFDQHGLVTEIEEKPKKPKSSYAVTGLYFFDAEAPKLAKTLRPSARGELEITDLNNIYLRRGTLQLEKLGRGIAWLDTGTHDTMLQAASFVQTVQSRQGMQIACLEEIAFRNGWIDAEQVARLAAPLSHSSYGRYLVGLVEDAS